ncbi:MAG: hypothetical protein CVU98_07430 [Firmicutes bacterium HGW-Firmicutes-3]|jgi:hypothetical protein|nr:MAG: hypothetical protein CVU98_07430 [Firmicutes bacterium HGW-Firmicutes-3]
MFKEDMKIVAVDAGYITPHICKSILDDQLLPSIPYKRPMTKKGFMKKHQYVYDEYYDCYISEKNELLMYSTTNRDGYREYKSDAEKCKNCTILDQCTNSMNQQKVITRHVWQDYIDEAQHLRHVNTIKGAYKRRKETIERVFADGKEKHGLRYTQLRGITNVITEITLKYAAMNLKKLGKLKWIWA